MDPDKLHETTHWVEDTAVVPPHVPPQWDAHEQSPGYYFRQKAMSESHMPFYNGMPRPAGIPYRGHQRLSPYQEFDSSNSISSASTAGRQAADGEHRQDDENAATSPDDEDDVEEMPDRDTQTEVVGFDPPLHRLVLDTRGGDVEDFGRWYFVSQMPAKDLEFFS